MELPPRARRIPVALIEHLLEYGTTSACAENTNFDLGEAPVVRNYLRVRGEYLGGDPELRLSQELPPRARRILTGSNAETMELGTTSACAENTGFPP